MMSHMAGRLGEETASRPQPLRVCKLVCRRRHNVLTSDLESCWENSCSIVGVLGAAGTF